MMIYTVMTIHDDGEDFDDVEADCKGFALVEAERLWKERGYTDVTFDIQPKQLTEEL